MYVGAKRSSRGIRGSWEPQEATHQVAVLGVLEVSIEHGRP